MNDFENNQEETGQDENKIKVILVGQMKVGKTNLINIVNKIDFQENTLTSSTTSISEKTIILNNNKYILNIWDTMGQEKLRELVSIFFKNSKIVIFVYDVTDEYTFTEIDNYWYPKIKSTFGDNIILGLLGNKIDLVEQEVVNEERGNKYADSIGARFGLTSAKTERNSFIIFLKSLLEDYLKKFKPEKSTSFTLEKQNVTEVPKKKKPC